MFQSTAEELSHQSDTHFVWREKWKRPEWGEYIKNQAEIKLQGAKNGGGEGAMYAMRTKVLMSIRNRNSTLHRGTPAYVAMRASFVMAYARRGTGEAGSAGPRISMDLPSNAGSAMRRDRHMSARHVMLFV